MYSSLIEAVLKYIGGQENILTAAHCMTRLRLKLSDIAKADEERLKEIEGVLGVVRKGSQIQIIIGPDVANVYKEFVRFTGIGEDYQTKAAGDGVMEQEKLAARMMNTIAGIFNPIVPALAGAGLIKAILALLVAAKLLSSSSSTYMVLNTISDGVFSFLPFLLACSSAKIFKMNTYVAAAIAGGMLHPAFTRMIADGIGQISFLALPLNLISYHGSVLPIILAIWFASYVEKGLDRMTHKSLKIIIVPAFTILIATPVSLLLIGPTAQVLGNWIADGVSLLFEKGGIFAGLIYGGVYSAMVVTGLHHGMVPVLVDGISRFGYNRISPVSGSANMGQAGAAFGVWLRAKDKNTKTVALSAMISALSGVTEPAIYGVNLRLKKPFLGAAVGGMAGGGFAALMKCRAYAMGGPSFLTLPMFIGDPGNVFYVALAFTIAFTVAAITTYILGFEESAKTKIGEI